MSWLAVDKDGEAWIYEGEPVRNGAMWDSAEYDCIIITPKSAEKLAGKKMNWDDEAIEV